jgi:hypothetical protein
MPDGTLPRRIAWHVVSSLGQQSGLWDDLFAGYRRFRGVTYSASLEFLVPLIDLFDDFELIIGSEMIAAQRLARMMRVSDALEPYTVFERAHDENRLIEMLARRLPEPNESLLRRIVDGSIRFRLAADPPEHAKLYLLDGGPVDMPRRAVLGSPNLSMAAFHGHQGELILVTGDGDMLTDLEARYAAIQQRSADIDPSLLVDAEGDPAEVRPRRRKRGLAEAPVITRVDGAIGLAEVPPAPAANAAVTIDPDLLDEMARERAAIREALPKSTLKKPAVGRDDMIQVIRKVEAQLARRDAAPRAVSPEEIQPLRLDFDRMMVYRGNVEMPLGNGRLSPEAIDDLRIINEFFEALRIPGVCRNPEDAYNVYGPILAQVWAGPAIARLRRAVMQAGVLERIYQYPLFIVLQGGASAGKSTFARFAAHSLGVGCIWQDGNTLKASHYQLIRELAGEAPVVWDDPRDNAKTQVKRVIVRSDHEPDLRNTHIITINGESHFEPEVVKRAMSVHCSAAIVPSAAERKTQPVKILTDRMTGAGWRCFLARMRPVQERMLTEIAGNPAAPAPDVLEAASTLLHDLAVEALGREPCWLKPMDTEGYRRLAYVRLRRLLEALLRDGGETVHAIGDQLIFAVGRDMAKKLIQEVPAFLLPEALGPDKVAMNRQAVEEFVGQQPIKDKSRSRWLSPRTWFGRA